MTTTRRYSWSRSAVAAVAAAMLLVACTSGENKEPEHTMDTREAAYRIETHIKETLAQFPDTAGLTDPYKMDSLPCDAPDDGGSEDRVIVEHDYVISGVSSEDFQGYFDTVERHWEQRGYRKLRADRNGPSLEIVYTDSDGFRLQLATSADGTQVSISSQSPCIWPNGRPPEAN